jgi:DNA-binding MurR/RpiR family transcriptional regulator
MKSPTYLINKQYNRLRKSEKRVAEYVQQHMDEVVLMSLQGLAKKCGTSDATVLRFCRSLGYMGFSDFKTSLVPELLSSGQKTYVDIEQNQDPASIKDIFHRNFHQQLDSTLKNCDYDILCLTAQYINNANKILIVGLGGSAGVANIFCDSLISLGIYNSFHQDRSIIQNAVTTMTTGDVLLGISHSGETEEIVSAARMAREYGAVTVGVTNFSPSPLTDVCEFILLTSVPDNLLGSYSCQARISQLALLELVLNEISIQLAVESTGEHST